MFFPGSSIGNFTPGEASAFLQRLDDVLPVSGGLVIGVDLVKDRAVLQAAYNDRAPVTADFNLTLRMRIRHEPHTDLDPARLLHPAFFNAAEPRSHSTPNTPTP